jgi:protein CMS1
MKKKTTMKERTNEKLVPVPIAPSPGPEHALTPAVLKDAPKKPHSGTPRALILSLSGIRCADIVRAVRHVNRPGGEIAKLFAKHFKVADQVKYLSHSRIAVAVGTPGRVAKLLENGEYRVDRLNLRLLTFRRVENLAPDHCPLRRRTP